MKKIWILVAFLLVISAIAGLGCGSTGSNSTTTSTIATNPGKVDQILKGTIVYYGTSTEVTVQALKADLSGLLGQTSALVSGGQAIYTLNISSTEAGTSYYLVATDAGVYTKPAAGNYAGAYGSLPGITPIAVDKVIYDLTTEVSVMTVSAGTLTGLNFFMHLIQ
jgi:hypothetical protein